MKKNYFIMSIGLGLLSSFGLSQNAYVTGNLKVKVEPNTLVYFGENLELTSAVSDDKVLENAGNIKIDGNLKNAHTSGENFVSTWEDANNYGQVIINTDSQGKLAMNKGSISPATFTWGQFAIPFKYANAEEAMQNLFEKAYPSNSRYKASMHKWHNLKFRYDHLSATSTFNPGDYVILNLVEDVALIKALMESQTKQLYKGEVTSAAYTVNYEGVNFPNKLWSVWKNDKNYHKEKYKSYIVDAARELADDQNYGKFFYRLGNPYTSNIDLRKVTNIDFTTVVKHTGNAGWNTTAGVVTSTTVKANHAAGTWTGDKDAVIVQPFEPFELVYKDNASYSFTFNNDLKTFTMGSEVTDVLSAKTNGSDFHQLALGLVDTDGNFTGNKVYIAVTPEVEAGKSNVLETEYFNFENEDDKGVVTIITGFYLAQENAEGLPTLSSERKMDINTIPPTYMNKPIPMFFNRTEGDNNAYYLKANLFYGSIFNQLDDEDGNYSDGNSFYFFDGREDVMIPITTDFSYYVAAEDNNENVYEVYWNVEGEDSELSLEDLNADATKIYNDKLNQTHKVRFNSKWTSADIKVYDVSGRSIKSFNNVKTQSDLDLNLYGRGVYIVRIKANTGEVYTQKIIK